MAGKEVWSFMMQDRLVTLLPYQLNIDSRSINNNNKLKAHKKMKAHLFLLSTPLIEKSLHYLKLFTLHLPERIKDTILH